LQRPLGAALWLGLLMGLAGPARAADPPDPRPEKRVGARGTAQPGLVFDSPNAQFGDVHQFAEVRHLFPFKNGGSVAVTIEQAISLEGTGRVEAMPRVVKPGGTGEVLVVQPVGGKLGQTAFRYALITDEPGVSRYRFSLSGFTESAFEPEKGTLAFGQVDRTRGAGLELELTSREVPRLEVEGFEDLPPWLSLEIAGRLGEDQQGLLLAAKLAGKPPLGWQHGTVLVKTNVERQPLYPLQYAAVILDDLVPSEFTIPFELVEPGKSYSRKIELRSRSGAAVLLHRAIDPAGWVKARWAPCPRAPEDPACVQLEVELPIAAMAPTGPFSGRLELTQGKDGEILPLLYQGIVMAPGTRIRQLEAPEGAGGTTPHGGAR
jgi:hypothetical protein